MQSSDPRRLPMRSRSDNSRYETPGATSAIHPSSQRVLQIVEGHAGRRGLLTLVGSCCWALPDRPGTTGSGLFAVRNRPVADIWAASNASITGGIHCRAKRRSVSRPSECTCWDSVSLLGTPYSERNALLHSRDEELQLPEQESSKGLAVLKHVRLDQVYLHLG